MRPDARRTSAGALAVVLLLAAVAPAAASGRAKIGTGARQDPGYLRELASSRYLEGDLEGAARLYLEIARLPVEPDRKAAALLNASWLQFLLGSKAPALASLHAALRADPDLRFDPRLFSPGFEQLYLEARVLSVRELMTRPAPRKAIEPKPGSGERPGAEAAYRQGVESWKRGDLDAALAFLQRAASLTYGSDEAPLELRRKALMRLGLIYYERGQWGDAASAFEEAVALRRNDGAVWKNLGLARLHQGDGAAAIEAFREAYALAPGDPANARSLARVLIEARRWDDAVSWISDAVRHHERNAYLRLRLGEAHAGRGAHRAAAEAWRAAMDLDTTLDWSHGRQAALLLALSRLESEAFAETAAIARVALEHHPRDATFWNLLGLAQRAGGDLAGARDSFLKACDYDDGSAEYRTNLGRTYAEAGDLPRAEEEFVHALTLEPDLPAAQAHLAQVRKRLQEQ